MTASCANMMGGKNAPLDEVTDHGGSLARAERLFPDAPKPWLDLSTGINPHPYPTGDVPASAFSRLPEEARLRELTASAAHAYGAPSPDLVVAAPGTQILLPLTASLIPPGRAAIWSPTYAEHRRAAALAGHAVSECADLDQLAAADLAELRADNDSAVRWRATADDIADYQTVFAKEEGSVAAPTAGLHFTQRLFDKLREAGIGAQTITLHVGAGTFLPVTVDDTDAHQMHSEWGEITAGQADQINQARKEGRRIVAVGTTSLRLLESAADEFGDVQPFSDETDIFITPGYRFRVVDALLTNFHLPRSTLFMLVCAFAGTERMKRAYGEAIERNYRFFSYGDACLLERAK